MGGSDEEMSSHGRGSGCSDDECGHDHGHAHGGSKELPDGVRKEIITDAPTGEWKKPKSGDEVTVHYVGTLESTSEKFDSSRDRSEPFKFILGKGAVIKGWDLGVATMKKGEVAKFTLKPEFAYGENGSGEKIPPNSTLAFEIELIGWCSKDDLFGDEGVIKTIVKEGSGWKKPKIGEEVLVTLKVEAAGGSHIEERKDLEYTLGSGLLGPIAKVCDKSLQQMKKGEEVALKCTKDYAYGEEYPDGVTVMLTLHEIFEIRDVSFSKDKSMMKKTIKEGAGYEQPKECAKVKVAVEAATDGVGPIPGFVPKVLEFTLGDGDVCDALEFVVGDMKKGERAVLTVTHINAAKDAQLGLADVVAEKMIVFTLELQEFEKAKDVYSMSQEEKVDFGISRKDIGSALFKKGRIELALQRYTNVLENFGYIDDFKDANKDKAKELKLACELNKAACYLKLNDYVKAKASCNAVLKDEKQNVKALYRRAQSEFGLKNFSDCISDCKSLVNVDPRNKDARALLKKAKDGQKEVDRQAKGLYANMCRALGKGPIPEPGRSKRPHEDVEGEEDDDEFGEADMETKESDVAANAGEALGPQESVADVPMEATVAADVPMEPTVAPAA